MQINLDIKKLLGIIGIGIGVVSAFAIKAPILIYPMLILDALWLIVLGAFELLIHNTATPSTQSSGMQANQGMPIPYTEGMVVACRVCHNPMEAMEVAEGVELYCPKCGRHIIVHKENIKMPVRIIVAGTPSWQKAVKTIGEGASRVHLVDMNSKPPKLID